MAENIRKRFGKTTVHDTAEIIEYLQEVENRLRKLEKENE
jgi:hypothetical protein